MWPVSKGNNSRRRYSQPRVAIGVFCFNFHSFGVEES